MARRGDALREHIVRAAKDVFLELGFARASMDVVAARAETSKRSLYAHFASKDALFLAVLDLARELYLGRLGTPGDYAHLAADPGDVAETVTLFCGRFLQLLAWEPPLRTFRLIIAEAERVPEAATRFHRAVFAGTHERLAGYLAERCPLTPVEAAAVAEQLLGRAVYPRLVHALLGVVRPSVEWPDEASIAADVDLAPLRATAAALLPR